MSTFFNTPDEQAAETVAVDDAARGPLRCLREAIRIARLDDHAIVRMSKDRTALLCGACVLAAGGLLGYISELLFSRRTAENGPDTFDVILGAPFVVIVTLLASAINIAVIHGLAKLVFGATGSYVSLVRVLWLGSIVTWLAIIPAIGGIVAGVWSLLILLVTFENVDGVERLQALMLVVVFGAFSLLLRVLLSV